VLCWKDEREEIIVQSFILVTGYRQLLGEKELGIRDRRETET
jgi:hypothetical protein